ncbi:MAG: two-component regulator propeller domain-containing protein [Pseudohongiella sp.]
MKRPAFRPIIDVVFLMLFLSICSHGRAQTDNIFFEHLTVTDGLSQNSVHAIVQDHQGYLWLATQDGLNRYDGYDFVVYRHQSDAGSDDEARVKLSNSTVWSLYEDSKGTLWAGTANGLNRYQRATDSFVQYNHDANDAGALSHPVVLALLDDSAGNFWVGTSRGGLNLLDRDTGRFTHYRHDPGDVTSLSSDRINTLVEGKNGVLWIGTEDAGLNRFDVSTGQVTRYRHQPDVANSLSSDDVTTLMMDSEGTLWIGTNTGGLNSLDPDTGRITRYLHDAAVPGSISSNSLRSLYEDSQGRMWVGHYLGGGLDLFDRDTGVFTPLNYQPGVANSLSDDHVLAVLEDSSGILWFGTHVGGLNKYDAKQARFRHYQHQWWHDNSLSQNTVRAFYRDDRTLYIGTEGGLNALDLDTGDFTHYVHDPADPQGIPHNIVRALDMDAQGQLWLATHGGLSRFDPATETFTNYHPLDHNSPDNSASLSNDVVWRVLVDSRGQVWAGARDALNVLDPLTGRFTRYEHDPDDPGSIPGDRISALYEDRAGHIWFSTVTTGVSRLNVDTGELINFTHEPGNNNSLSNASVFSIIEDNDGIVWFGSRGGLNRFDPDTETFTVYSVADGLPNEVIYGILIDDNGLLWMSTNKGISRFDAASETFTNFGLNDGLQAEEFNNGAYFKAETGEMYFGGINGFNVFNSSDIVESTYSPPVVVTRFTVLNEDRSIDAGAPVVELSHEENYLSFEFAALDFSAPARNQYMYRLTGVDEDWIPSEGRRYASYTNLQPGRYVFEVRGSNSDGLWSSHVAAVPIYIAPALWQTVWFQVALSISLALLLLSLYRYKTISVSRRNQELELVVGDRTRELMRANESLQQEVTRRQQAEEEIRKIAYYDYLTGLPNRRLFMSLGDQALITAAREHTKAAILFVDIDLFKEINDKWGHDVGDSVLVVLAERIRSVLRASDIVCRMGGDEFVLLLTDIKDHQFAARVADKLKQAITAPVDILESVSRESHQVSVGVSIGISLYPEDDNDLERLLVAADQAMYTAKKDAQAVFRFHSDGATVAGR